MNNNIIQIYVHSGFHNTYRFKAALKEIHRPMPYNLEWSVVSGDCICFKAETM